MDYFQLTQPKMSYAPNDNNKKEDNNIKLTLNKLKFILSYFMQIGLSWF